MQLAKRDALERLLHLREALLQVLEEIGGFSAYVFHLYPDHPACLQIHITTDRFYTLVDELGLGHCVQMVDGDDGLDKAAVTLGGVELYTLVPKE